MVLSPINNKFNSSLILKLLTTCTSKFFLSKVDPFSFPFTSSCGRPSWELVLCPSYVRACEAWQEKKQCLFLCLAPHRKSSHHQLLGNVVQRDPRHLQVSWVQGGQKFVARLLLSLAADRVGFATPGAYSCEGPFSLPPELWQRRGPSPRQAV